MVEMLDVAVCGEMEGTRRLNRFAAEKKNVIFSKFLKVLKKAVALRLRY